MPDEPENDANDDGAVDEDEAIGGGGLMVCSVLNCILKVADGWQ